MSRKIPTRDVSPDPVQIHEPQLIDLYASRKKIHARSIQGFYQNLRNASLTATLFVFFALPWVNWEGRQAVLFDLTERHFYLFGWTFLPQDLFYLSWLFIIAAFGLFTLTVFAGRVWCGYTCPQTVWTKAFMWVEERCEGNRNARLRLDAAPMSLSKLVRRSLKHTGWLIISAATGIAFIGYFWPVRDLWDLLITGTAGFWLVFWLVFFTLATYVNAGWMREQICLHVCPYGRFQSVMFDRDTLIISYDHHRGESRGSRKRGQTSAEVGLGDCIDCTLCVQVCPTGIDIRDGLQFECIQCAACIDACDSVMDQMGYDRGLVRYTTENHLEHQKPGRPNFLRPRLVGYGFVLTAMIGVLLVTLALRVPVSIEALRDRGQLFNETFEGDIENSYTLKIQNKTQQAMTLTLTVDASFPLTLLGTDTTVRLAAGELATVPITLTAKRTDIPARSNEIVIGVISADGQIQSDTDNTFLAPQPARP